MIKQALLRERFREFPFDADDALSLFVKNHTKFFSKKKSYQVVIGWPMGMGTDKQNPDVSETSYPLYQIYGIAAQLKNHVLLGRKVPLNKSYRMPLSELLSSCDLFTTYTVSDELTIPTKFLVEIAEKTEALPIKGVILDDINRLAILTDVLPSQVTSQELTKMEE